MLTTIQVTDTTIISQNIPAEQPFANYSRIVANQKEFLLGPTQLKVWRKIGEHEQLSVDHLHKHLLSDGISIEFNDVLEIISLFLRHGLVAEIKDVW